MWSVRFPNLDSLRLKVTIFLASVAEPIVDSEVVKLLLPTYQLASAIYIAIIYTKIDIDDERIRD